MLKKTLIPSILCTTITFIVMITVLPAADHQPFPEEITINNEGYEADRKGPVEFTHIDHAESYEVACKECHHDYMDGKNIWEEGDYVPKCIECHDPQESDGNIKNLRLSFHRNCKICHRNLAKEGISEDAPYTKCRDCHS
jgi:Ni/Co efflux regulator RcnB